LERKRVLRTRLEKKGVWRPRIQNKTVWTPRSGDLAGRSRVPELHRTLGSAVNFRPGEKVPHLGSGAAHRRATCITGTSGKAALDRT